MDGLAFDDMDEFGRELDDPLAELEQDVIHMLLETYGSNPDVLTRGIGLIAALSGPANRLPSVKALAEQQLEEDDRIDRAQVTFTPTDTRGEYRVDLVLQVSDTELGITLIVDGAGNWRRVV